MTKQTYFGDVDEQGKLKIHNNTGFLNNLRDLAGKKIRLTIERAAKRSDPQNRFYWGNFIQAQIECFKERWGETYRKEQIHDWNKTNFWGTEQIIESTGEVIKMPASSTTYSKLEWEEKLEVIRAWFLQNMDWAIGYPSEQTDLDFERAEKEEEFIE